MGVLAPQGPHWEPSPVVASLPESTCGGDVPLSAPPDEEPCEGPEPELEPDPEPEPETPLLEPPELVELLPLLSPEPLPLED
jgi:hypothetical protein